MHFVQIKMMLEMEWNEYLNSSRRLTEARFSGKKHDRHNFKQECYGKTVLQVSAGIRNCLGIFEF